jgi:hypothetical protein
VRPTAVANLRLLAVALLCVVVASCADGWPHRSKPAPKQVAQTCRVTGSRIIRSDCSTIDPASTETGEEYDRERQQRRDGQPYKGVLSPAGN